MSGGARRDVRELLGMASWGARRGVVPAYGVTFALIVVDTKPVAGIWALSWVALAILTVSCAIIVHVDGDPLPLGWTVVLGISGPAAIGLILVGLPGPLTAGTAIWPMGASVSIYTYACVRGRIGVAWVGITVMAVEICLWSSSFGDPYFGLRAAVFDYAPMIMATFFAVTIRPAAATIFALQERSSDEVAREAAAQAVLEERDAQLRRLDELARPLLRRIVATTTGRQVADQTPSLRRHDDMERDDIDPDDAELTPEERAACALLEAHLRDTLRARVLVDDEVSAAVRSARSAGVEVVLLDDGGGVQWGEPLRAALLPHLVVADGGKVTARVLPAGRVVAMTVLVTSGVGGDEIERYEYDAAGALLDSPGVIGVDEGPRQV